MVPFTPPPAWRDNRPFVRLACAVWIGGTLIAAATAQRQTDRAIEQARETGRARYSWGVGFQQGLSSLWSLVALVGLVLVIIATWRLVRAHQLLGRPNTRWGPGWAIAGRLIPLASAVLPALQLGELWQGSTPGLRHGDPAWRSASRGRAMVVLVVLGVAQTVLGIVLAMVVFVNAIDSLGDRSADALADSLDASRPWTLVGAVLGVALAALTTWMLLQIAERQQRLYEADPNLPPAAAPQWAAPVAAFPAGWYPDPWGQFASRWFDGVQWTSHGWGEPSAFTAPMPPPPSSS